jgi:hypothetical protein
MVTYNRAVELWGYVGRSVGMSRCEGALIAFSATHSRWGLREPRRGWAGREGGDSDVLARKGEQMADKWHITRTF